MTCVCLHILEITVCTATLTTTYLLNTVGCALIYYFFGGIFCPQLRISRRVAMAFSTVVATVVVVAAVVVVIVDAVFLI